MTNVAAYHNDPANKAAILAQLQAHHDADELIKGRYWEDGKGCAVGCSIYSGNHSEYEPRFGIPQMLAWLEDRIFEGLPNETAKAWPIRFMSAIRPGADLSLVGWKFLHWLLTDETVNPGINHPLVRDAVKKCVDVLVPLTKGEAVDEIATSAACAARMAARGAAWSVASTESSESSQSSMAWKAERRAAWSAAWSAACAAKSALWSPTRTEASAESAASSASSAAENAARSENRSAAYIKMADKIIDLIEAA